MRPDLNWLKRIPVNEMVKFDWIKRQKGKMDQLKEVLRFFGIASVDQWGYVWPRLSVAYRQSNQYKVFPEAVPDYKFCNDLKKFYQWSHEQRP